MNYDLIVALGGGDDRKAKAAEMFNDGMANYILFTGESNDINTMNNLYLRWGIFTHGLTPTYTSLNTWDDGDVIRDIAKVHNFNNIIIVTSDYHIPRCRIIFSKDMSKLNLKYVGVPSPFGFSRVVKETLGCIKAVFTK